MLNIYTIPATPAAIKADTLSNLHPLDEHLRDDIAAGEPIVYVDCTTDGFGNTLAVINAGVLMADNKGFYPAQPQGDADTGEGEYFSPKVEFKNRDGRLNAGRNAELVLKSRFTLDPTIIIYRDLTRC